MELQTRLEPRLEHRLKLTQELRAGIELLTLTEPELDLELERASEENPFLKLEEDGDPREERYRYGTDYAFSDLSEEGDALERQASEMSLWEHLRWQIQISPVSQDEKAHQEMLLEFLSEEGYLREEDETLAKLLGIPVKAVERARSLLMTLEPEGVGARGPIEAMLYQLKSRGKEGSLAYRILTLCQEELEQRDWDSISKKLGVTSEELKAALEELKQLKPIPFAGWEGGMEGKTYFPPPDLILIPLPEGGFEVQLYEEGGKRRPSWSKPTFAWEKLSREEKEFIRQKIRAARLLLSSLTFRQLTLLRIAHYIIKKQGHILLHGEKEAVPLTMREIANALGYQESTVSRTLKNKTILTPWGIKELKSFLRHGGVEHFTPYQIQKRIQEIVEKENPSAPLSDEEIRMRLEHEGIRVARRTIAKYRAILKIPGQKERHKLGASLQTSPPRDPFNEETGTPS